MAAQHFYYYIEYNIKIIIITSEKNIVTTISEKKNYYNKWEKKIIIRISRKKNYY